MDYTIIYSSRKTLAIEIQIGGKIVIRAPKRVTRNEIDSFIKDKEDWILKTRQKQIQRGYNDYHKELSESEIFSLKEKAQNYIPQRVKHFSEIMGLFPTAVKISSAKKIFGSCSGNNSLNFSYRLMLYPLNAVDYVIVHELAHIKHHNHSSDFYELIEKYMPDYKERIKLLKK